MNHLARSSWPMKGHWSCIVLLLIATTARSQETIPSTPGLPRAEGQQGAGAPATFPHALQRSDTPDPEPPPEVVNRPRWFRYGLEHRSRYEYLANDFRSSATGNSQGLMVRTLFSVGLQWRPVVVGVELQDSRAYATAATPLNTTIVNPLEVLQAHVGLRRGGFFVAGDSTALTLGRFTMDLGSRRLVARSRFRNTISSFTGIDLTWMGPDRRVLRGFAVHPVRRRPTDPEDLAHNRPRPDRENSSALFWGVFLGSPARTGAVQAEAYILGLNERDGSDAPSANRRIFTPGARIMRASVPGRFDFQAELMFQLGKSRSTAAATNTTDLEHRAFSGNVTGGYRFDAPWSPRVSLHYDFASGDGDPQDSVNGRFDPLFGARRFELGPTGLYGAFSRSNISSPGLRVEAVPNRGIDVFAGYRMYWLASPRDAWTTAALRDPSGNSGSFVGQQVETRVRWNLVPKRLMFEAGGAWLVRGAFATDVPNAKASNPAFLYMQVTGTI